MTNEYEKLYDGFMNMYNAFIDLSAKYSNREAARSSCLRQKKNVAELIEEDANLANELIKIASFIQRENEDLEDIRYKIKDLELAFDAIEETKSKYLQRRKEIDARRREIHNELNMHFS